MNRIFFLSILMPLLVTGFIYGMYVYNESELLTKVSQRTKTVAVFMLYIVQELLVIFISDKLVGMICFQYTLGVSAFMLSRKYAGLLILTTPVITNLYLFFSGRDSILSLVLGLVSIYVTLVGMHVIKRRLLFQDLLQYFIILMLANVIPIHRLGQKNVDILSEFYDKNDVVWIALGTCLIFFLTFLLLREVDLKRKRIARLVYEESHDK
ncbi:hypothetical protein [Liquorilactobacillus satsumensis]|nr:hypothetical protein [Liquorilactobacillus satsumensis]